MQRTGAQLENGFLVLATMGRVAVRWSRPGAGTPKTVTLSQEPEGWYVICSCAEVPTRPVPRMGQETGIDLGVQVLLSTAEGWSWSTPRHHRTAEKRLATAHGATHRQHTSTPAHQHTSTPAHQHTSRAAGQQGSRAAGQQGSRQQGSTRRKQAINRCARQQQRGKRQRADVHHKVARHLVQTDDTGSLEDVQVAPMVRHRQLARSSSDIGWAQFRAILAGKTYTAACAGKPVLAGPAHDTSQDGSGGGERVPKSRSVRTHLCPTCGPVADPRPGTGLRRARGRE